MGKRLEATPDHILRRIANDRKMSESARRNARRELDRRERGDLCPNGKGCANWTCGKEH